MQKFDIRRVSGVDAITTWKRLRAEVGTTGNYPLLTNDADWITSVRFHVQPWSSEETLNVRDAWLKSRREDLPPPPRGQLEGESAQNDLYVRYDVELQIERELDIVLVPASSSWEALLHLRFGGWDHCPLADEHAAILSDWHRRYGAEIASCTRNTIELLVSRPPRSVSEATDLAIEQYWYCPDIIWESFETIDARVGVVLNGESWFFGWS